MQVQITNNLVAVWGIVKIFFIVGLSVYLIFAIVVVQQSRIMSETVRLDFESSIKILALIHLLLEVGLLVFAIVVL